MKRKKILFNNFIGHLDWHWERRMLKRIDEFFIRRKTLNWKREKFCVWRRASEKGYIRIEDRLRVVSAVADRSHCMYAIYILQILRYFACLSFNNISVFFLFFCPEKKRKEENIKKKLFNLHSKCEWM